MTRPTQTWYCPECGSTDITHDALAVYNPNIEDYEVTGLLDGMQCENCGSEHPTFGIPGEDEEDEREH